MSEPRSRKVDVFALLLLALGLFLLVSLISYRPSDLAPSSSATEISNLPSADSVMPRPLVVAPTKVLNSCGRSGAYAAEGLFRLLGWGAYFFVGSLIALDIWLLLRRPVNDL